VAAFAPEAAKFPMVKAPYDSDGLEIRRRSVLCMASRQMLTVLHENAHHNGLDSQVEALD